MELYGGSVCLSVNTLYFPCADPHAGGASAAVEAGLSPETGGGRGPSPGTGTTNLRGPSHGQGAAPGLMTGSRGQSVRCKRSLMNGCTGVAVSFDGLQHGHFCVGFFKQSCILVSLPLSCYGHFQIRLVGVCRCVASRKSRPSCRSWNSCATHHSSS